MKQIALIVALSLLAQVALAGPIPIPPPQPTEIFITTWKTDNPGTSNSTSITIPMTGRYCPIGGPCAGDGYHVDWDNDGVFDQFNIFDPVTHDFGVAGTYTIRIYGTFRTFSFNNGGDKEKILSVDQWGRQVHSWISLQGAFYGAVNLLVTATDSPSFNSWEFTNISHMFRGATLANPDTRTWYPGVVESWDGMFKDAISANPDVSGWSPGNVRYMFNMFEGAISANPDVSSWDMSHVLFTNEMFKDAISANPDVSGWDTSSLYDASGMFQGAISFDRDIGSWDVTELSDANDMFDGVTLSTANYESLLIGWGAQTPHEDVRFDGGNSVYCSGEAAAARANLIATYRWVITDGGRCPPPPVAPDLTPESDTGISNSDNITVDNTPDFYVVCLTSGDTVTLYTDNPAVTTVIGTHLCSTIGIEIATVTNALIAGTHNITYTYTYVIGESGHSPSLAIIVDLIFSDGFEEAP